MTSDTFPIDKLCSSVVQLLDAVKYDDDLLTPEERVDALKDIFAQTTAYLAQPLQKETLEGITSTRKGNTIRTITQFIAYTYSKVPRDIQIHCSIYWCLITFLDDEVNNDPNSKMASFCQNLIQGKEQQHPFWILMKEHLPHLSDHYGNFCSFDTFRATIDYFEGCWIEQHNFQGYPNSKSNYPFMLRRFGSLGGAVGGTLFPAREFDDQKLFKELSSLMAQMDGPVAYVNDLLSFFKEFNNEQYSNIGEEPNFVSCLHTVHGLTLEQAIERVAELAISSCVKLLDVIKDTDPKFQATVHAFIQGYITWHFVDLRYRLREVYDKVHNGKLCDGSVGAKFCNYYEKAFRTGWVDLDQWALPEN